MLFAWSLTIEELDHCPAWESPVNILRKQQNIKHMESHAVITLDEMFVTQWVTCESVHVL